MVQRNKQKPGQVSIPPNIVNSIYDDLAEAVKQMNRTGLQPVLMVAPAIRRYVKRLIEPAIATLPVISFNEIPTHIPLQSRIQVDIDPKAA